MAEGRVVGDKIRGQGMCGWIMESLGKDFSFHSE